MSVCRDAHGAILNVLARAGHSLSGLAARWQEMEEFDYLPREKQERLIMGRIRDLLAHAFENVPFYRDIAHSEGLQAEDFRTSEDLQRLPVMTKEIIQTNREALEAESGWHGKRHENHTGGSTGQMLHFLQDDRYKAYANADKQRLYEWCNYRRGDPIVFLWGADLDASAHRTPVQRLKDRLLLNLLWVNTFELTVDLLDEYHEQILAHHPTLIVGYVSSLTMYARFIQSCGLKPPSPKGIQSSAEPLTPADRKLLEDTFGCRVFDRYGCREVGVIAHECEAHEGLHFSPLCNYTELLNADDEPVEYGEPGRVIVTNLNNYAMPFIRYENGDMAVRTEAECSCGRTSPMLSRVTGREYGVIVTPSGGLLYGEFPTHFLYNHPSVLRMQFVQETVEDLLIRLQMGDGSEADTVKDAMREYIHRFGDEAFNIRFEICDEIETSPSGKYQFIISHIDRPFETPNDMNAMDKNNVPTASREVGRGHE